MMPPIEPVASRQNMQSSSALPDDVVVSVNNVSKKFCRNLRRSMVYGIKDLSQNLLGMKPDTTQLRQDEFWALNDVSFDLRRGETLGIIGVNGSGKSTLLRVLTGIFPPDKGEIAVKGRIGALVAVGAGFHPHMTGRENVYLNGTILGMSRKQLEKRFDEIADFAEIGEFLDAPVSTYSSGMRVRLGFAIAVHCDPDILLIDEVLSVGDLNFRNKSLRFMADYRKKAKGIIFISHNLEQVRILCSRAIILHQGQQIFDGLTHEGLVAYEELSRDARAKQIQQNSKKKIDKNIKRAISDKNTFELVDLALVDELHKNISTIGMDEPLRVSCIFELKQAVESLSFYFSLTPESSDSHAILVTSNDYDKMSFKELCAGRYRITITIKEHHLAPGVYNPNLGFRNDVTFETYQKIYTNLTVVVRSDGLALESGRGLIAVREIWDLTSLDEENALSKTHPASPEPVKQQEALEKPSE